ncbi:MAG TPA: ATP-dependent DNA helicase [Nocardioidaceae bacterium]|nr:ATP-dependent DNA helicase [Nocardioidaceae bacterium]
MTSYRLVHPSVVRTAAPVLDSFQQSVVAHESGPLLVLAGPGTGKTTTLVEAIVDRIERRGVAPDSVLALTFSRKAAEQLRDRVTARVGRTMSTTLSSTFHSFAYGLIRAHGPKGLYDEPLRLLSAPEQDVVLQRLLTHEAESVRWPAALDRAVGTRGFAREVQTVLARAREKGLEPSDLVALGRAEDQPVWTAAGLFMEQYLDILDSESAIDYPELIHRAVALAETPDVRERLRRQYSWVFVDEYQDTDPSQVRLLQALAGDGRNLVVVGDPDQSIYAFRGAEVRGILDFPDQFRTREGERARTVALRVTRRFGPVLLEASRSVAGAIPTKGSIDAELFQAFRNPEPTQTPFGPGRVEVRTFDTARAETEHVADLLRRAHLEDGVPWSQMAVLVRSGRSSIPSLRRSLGAAGVPVEVASDDTPLVREPAVAVILDALRVVLNLDNDDPAHPDYIGTPRVESLLGSPLAGLDATEVRALARLLRAREKTVAAAEDRGPRPSPELMREALLAPEVLEGIPGRPAVKLFRLGTLLRGARVELDAGATAEEVLWTLWSGTRWPVRLRAMVDEGGGAARMAHRDLDALCALFDEAARTEEQRGHTSVASFLAALAAQQIPADTLAEQGVRGDAVRLLTAHRSKGLEWRFVVVVSVQEGSWPDLRRRTTLLQADRIGTDGVLPPVTTATLLAEERRLFYVACTRAAERLLVTAVESPEEDGDQPSRFLDELAVEPVAVKGRPPRPLSLAGLVAELRRTASDPAASPALRGAAARRLARLALATAGARPLAAQADPAHWWGTRGRSLAEQPLRSADEPVTLSASALESILTCPAKWFLEREAGGASPSTAAQGFGLVVHALADRIGKGELTDTDDLMAYVDRVWGQISFRTPWSRSREREEVKAALARFVAWHSRPGARTVVATEEHLTAEVTLPDGQRVRLNGYADRLELDEDGRVVVIDLKTSKYPPADKDLPANPQLGLYQYAVSHGAVDGLLAEHPDRPSGPVEPGGAELVQLRREVKGGAKVQQQVPQQPDEDGHLPVEKQLMEAVRVLRGEEFPARAGGHCDHCSFHAICPVKGAGTVLS